MDENGKEGPADAEVPSKGHDGDGGDSAEKQQEAKLSDTLCGICQNLRLAWLSSHCAAWFWMCSRLPKKCFAYLSLYTFTS